MKHFVILLTFTLSACSQPPLEIKLSKNDYKIVDSLVSNNKKLIELELDSLCKIINEEEYLIAIDSITKLRMEYIKEILE